jgi:hypothetical protein
VLTAFRERGGDGKPAALQVHLSWALAEGEALSIAYEQCADIGAAGTERRRALEISTP